MDHAELRYSTAARILHWIIALGILLQVAIGVIMAWRGHVLDIWDSLTDALFSTHKSLGFVLLVLVLARIAVRRLYPPPAKPPMPRWQLRAAVANHRALYVLMLVVPLLGWLTASFFPALQVFGTISLPAITPPNRAVSDDLAIAHGLAALLLVGLIGLHLGAVLFHVLIRRDHVIYSMLPDRFER
ncbi:MAG: cytochrome b [Acetobacteraceae bacterium]|nr:cytochrome b [Acetobacteraceae bacterium]